jgi:hypothetical protein
MKLVCGLVFSLLVAAALFGSTEQAYRQHRLAVRQPPVPPAPATSAAPVISDSKLAAPSDHP